MAIETAVRMVTENRQGQRCFSDFTFHVSVSGRDREVISFSDGSFRSWIVLEYFRRKGTMNLLLKLIIKRWMREERGRSGVYAQADDGETGCGWNTESDWSDGLGAEGQCAEGYGRRSSDTGDCVSVRWVLVGRIYMLDNMWTVKVWCLDMATPDFCVIFVTILRQISLL